ncbi:alpha/beta fold hydrolase [Phreatobacter sp.]|uniref:alpha/beta fold hydrolase n=1 Tax=Phreatobacter sp. TaxID=1966341 RepID=UPI003F7050E4
MATAPGLTDIGTGRPLVFLHGWSVDRSFFDGQRPLALEGFRVIAPDLPGHDGAPIGQEPATIAGLADATADLLARTGNEKVVLVGWSMGATVALDLIARHGAGRVAGLAIVDMTPKVPNAPDWSFGLANGQTLVEALAAAERMGTAWERYAPRIAEAMFAPDRPCGALLAARASEKIARRQGTIMAALWRSLVEADHRETVRTLPVPVLAIAGAESRLYRPEVARWIAAHAPAGRATVVQGAGHAPHVERPDAFNALVAGFARDLATP